MKDSDLNTLFKRLRKTESQSAPPFDQLARVAQHSRSRKNPLAPAIGLVAGACSVALVLALWPWKFSTPIDEAAAFAFAEDSFTQPLADLSYTHYESNSKTIVQLVDSGWTSPTDFLLELKTPNRESS